MIVGSPALRLGDVERVAQRMPHVAWLEPRRQRVLGRAVPQLGQHLLPYQDAPVRRAEDLVHQPLEIAVPHRISLVSVSRTTMAA